MKKVLYLGLDPTRYETKGELVHHPVIETVSLQISYDCTPFKYLLFTSRMAVHYFVQKKIAQTKQVIAIGPATADRLRDFDIPVVHIAEETTQEGVLALLQELKIEKLFAVHSKQARPLLRNSLPKATFVAIYETKARKDFPKLDLEQFSEIVFTSPSTVRAFPYQKIPKQIKLIAIGPVTAAALHSQHGSRPA